MIIIKEQIIVSASPEAVWHFLTHLHEENRYTQWHPQDHISYRLVKGDPESVGSIAVFQERIGKRTLKLKYKLTKANHHTILIYEATWPLSILRAGYGSFELKETESNVTEFTATVTYGYTLPVVGRLIDFLSERYIKQHELRRHMKEEGQNIAAYFRKPT